MFLYLMRHGIAEESAAGEAKADDGARKLTPKGIKKLHKAARGMASLSPKFDRVLTSPLARARETAEIVAHVLGLGSKVEEIAELSPDRSVHDLVGAVRNYPTDKEILLVGHEPLLSRTVSFLVSGSTEMEVRLKKGGLCCLELRARAAKEKAILHWSLAPKHLRRLAR